MQDLKSSLVQLIVYKKYCSRDRKNVILKKVEGESMKDETQKIIFRQLVVNNFIVPQPSPT